MGIFSFILELKLQMLYVLLFMSLIGFFFVPFIPLSFELACEISFPVGEAISTGMLMTGG